MKTPAYVQQTKGQFKNMNFFTAWLAYDRFFGYDVKFFEVEDLDSLVITKETPVFGGIGTMDKIFHRLGKTVKVPYYPTQLQSFLGRRICQMDLATLRDKVEEKGEHYFIKPIEEEKKTFNGHVVKAYRDLIYTAPMEGFKWVYASEPVEFVTEYRFFVHREQGIVGMKHYAGKWELMVDYSVAEAAVKAYTDSPIAYSLDMGLTTDGRTLLVECNDSISLGCYGLAPYIYGKMITDRWEEIMNS